MKRPFGQLLTTLVVLATTMAASASTQESERPGAWVVEGEAIYTARDALASWTGRAPLAFADLRFDPADPTDLELIARVRPAAFDSGNPLRDFNARRTVFGVDDHPEASARSTADLAAGSPRRVPGGWTVPVAVELTLHGVTVRYAAEALLQRDGTEWTGTTVLTVSLEAHGMPRPRLLGILTDDSVRVEVRVRARPAP